MKTPVKTKRVNKAAKANNPVNNITPPANVNMDDETEFFFNLVKATVVVAKSVPLGTNKNNNAASIEPEIITMPMSIVIPTPEDKFPLVRIYQAQNTFKQIISKRAEAAGEAIQIVDVVVESVTSLGSMTFAEYNLIPDSLLKQANTQETVSAN